MGDLHRTGRRVAIASIVVSGLLAASKIVVGLLVNSTSVFADGVESAGDMGTSAIVLFGLLVAAKPPDENHPYGHGRFESLTGLLVGLTLVVTGTGIAIHSLERVNVVHSPPAVYAIWPLLASIAAKTVMSRLKFHYGRKIHSASLKADGWNDMVDILSGSTALVAVGLTLYNPGRFLAADHYGGFAVGLIVIFTGVRVVRETTLQLMDTMPEPDLMRQIRSTALSVPGVLGVEKCYARKTGLQHHVDLHLEVDPQMTVRASHDIAMRVRDRIVEVLPWVADVLVHVEPYPPLLDAPPVAERQEAHRPT
jgi:cation diffusion facilitator family transporter